MRSGRSSVVRERGESFGTADVEGTGADVGFARMMKSEGSVDEGEDASGLSFMVKRDLEEGEETTDWSSAKVTSSSTRFCCSNWELLVVVALAVGELFLARLEELITYNFIYFNPTLGSHELVLSLYLFTLLNDSLQDPTKSF